MKNKKSTDYSVSIPKKIMRLCAMALVSDEAVGPKEKECITKIIYRDIIDIYKHKKSLSFSSLLPAEFVEDALKVQDGKISYNNVSDKSNPEPFDSWEAPLKTPSINKNKERGNILERAIEKEGLTQDTIYAKVCFLVEFYASRLTNKKNPVTGLFVDIDNLKQKEIVRELADYILVIKADNIIAESEREAFLCVARIMKERRLSDLWKELIKTPNEVLLEKDSGPIIRKDSLDFSDAKAIENSLSAYEIKGPLPEGLRTTLFFEKEKIRRKREHLHRKWGHVAFVAFCITAILLYFQSATLSEDKIIYEEHGIHGDWYSNPYIHDYYEMAYTDSLLSLGRSLYRNSLVDEGTSQEEIDSLIKTCPDEQLLASIPDSNSALNNIQNYYSDLIEDIPQIIKDRRIKRTFIPSDKIVFFRDITGELTGFEGIFYMLVFVLVGFVAVKMYGFILKTIKQFFSKSLKNLFLVTVNILCILLIVYYALDLINSISPIYINIFYTPFLVTVLMLSIEVMIFMRERHSEEDNDSPSEEERGCNLERNVAEHKHSSGLLITIVVLAIITDMCIGFIELPAHPSWSMLCNKFASAFLLGFLCFFFGKFLDMKARQFQLDIASMDRSIRNIKKINDERTKTANNETENS